MAYDADPSATHNPATGGTPTAAWGDILNANFAAIGGAWTAFTPTWTGASSNPAIGNGTLTGAYNQLGKLLFCRIRLVVGSTTTFGTGEWRFTLPNSLSAAATESVTAFANDDSTATCHVARASVAASGTFLTLRSHGGTGNFAATVPFTWATSDVLEIGPFAIEVA